MKSLNQRGAVDSWLIAFSVTLIVFFGAAGFGFWAYMSRQDYKDNVDAKIATAVAAAEKSNSDKKDAEFLEREKEPLKTYVGPPAYGSLSVSYPKTWSAYVDESGKGNASLDGSLNPNFVPGLTSGGGVALRMQILDAQYSQTLRSLEQFTKAGKIKVSPYTAPKVPSVVGIRVDGEVKTGKQGSMVILPIRDKTLQVWTEASQFVPDFNTIILPNLNFVP